MRAGLIALLFAGLGAASSSAQDAAVPIAVPDLQQAETLALDQQADERLTVPVRIGGRGPFGFIVDTGAERTVIASDLAASLGLSPGRSAIVHSMSEVSRIETVVIPALRVGTRAVNDIHAPSLARANLGAAGILGVDSLRTQRVTFDFRRREMTVTPSRRPEPQWLEGQSIVVTGRSIYGRLVLIDASLDGQRIWVIVDSGSEVSVGNFALRRALERRNRLGALTPLRMVSITGGVVQAEYSVARRIRIGGIDIVNLPVAFADAHPFRQLRLNDRPALLLGMDALQLFRRVSIDFPNRRVRVLLDDGAQLFEPPRLAAAGAAQRSR